MVEVPNLGHFPPRQQEFCFFEFRLDASFRTMVSVVQQLNPQRVKAEPRK